MSQMNETRQRAEEWKKRNKLKPLIKFKRAEIAYHIGLLISDILGRKVDLVCNVEEYDFWAVASKDIPFTAAEISRLLKYVGITDIAVIKDAMPETSNQSKGLGMDLSKALLEKIVKSSWEVETVTEDDIWLLNTADTAIQPKADENIFFIDNAIVNRDKLWSKDEIIDNLGKSAAYGDLVELCDRYVKDFGNELYWHYPISDGKHNGVYLVIVKEGILMLPYNEVSEECNAHFILSDAKLCSEQEIRYFTYDLEKNTKYFLRTMNDVSDFLDRLEVKDNE